jgi:hypothetical protein
MNFAQLAAVNRGVKMRIFKSVHEAEEWLRSTSQLP